MNIEKIKENINKELCMRLGNTGYIEIVYCTTKINALFLGLGSVQSGFYRMPLEDNLKESI